MGVHTFPKGISSKVNVIARQEFKLAYYEVILQYVSHCTSGIPTLITVKNVLRIQTRTFLDLIFLIQISLGTKKILVNFDIGSLAKIFSSPMLLASEK